MSRKRRKLSPELKVDAVKELLTGAKTAAEICRERDITDKLLYRWKTELLDYLTPAEFAAAYFVNNLYSPLAQAFICPKKQPHYMFSCQDGVRDLYSPTPSTC